MGHRFVLVHGAWHGGWCWDGIIRALEAQGHSAAAPTLPGQQPDDERASVRFDDYVLALTDLLQAQSEPVVLVGHPGRGLLAPGGRAQGA